MPVQDGGQANGKQLLLFLYEELRSLASRKLSSERPNHTLSTTALVNELYLRVARSPFRFDSQGHFKAMASHVMREILVDHARAHNSAKRGNGREHLALSELRFEIAEQTHVDAEVLDDALNRLAEIDPRQARVVEMRFFAGMTAAEIAEELGVSSKTVKRDWSTALAWLRSTLES